MGSFNSDFKVRIPEPCHEDWAQMNPEGKGRYCDSCEKVVVDFTNFSSQEIEEHLTKASGQSCGRFKQVQISNPTLEGHTFYRFPVQRVRLFLMAFVAAFGLEILGLNGDTLEASTFPSETELIEKGFEYGDSIRVHGKVLSVIDNEPLMYVTVLARMGEEVISATMSDVDGNFELSVPKEKVESGEYDLVIRYLGRERIEEGMRKDVEELVLFIDNSYALASVAMHAFHSPTDRYGDNIGIFEVEPECHLVGLTYTSFEQLPHFYRPMDEWLMMNFSEINHAGRW